MTSLKTAAKETSVSARLGFNGPIKVEDETRYYYYLCVGVDLLTSISGKPKRRTLSQFFRSSRVFRPSKHRYVE